VEFFVLSNQRGTTWGLSMRSPGGHAEVEPVSFTDWRKAAQVAETMTETTGEDWYPSDHFEEKPPRTDAERDDPPIVGI